MKRAIDNVKPPLEVKSRRVGGATYQVPVEVRPRRATTLAIRWVVDFSRARREKSMAECLAGELLDAANGLGRGDEAPRRHPEDGRVEQGVRPLPVLIVSPSQPEVARRARGRRPAAARSISASRPAQPDRLAAGGSGPMASAPRPPPHRARSAAGEDARLVGVRQRRSEAAEGPLDDRGGGDRPAVAAAHRVVEHDDALRFEMGERRGRGRPHEPGRRRRSTRTSRRRRRCGGRSR